MRSILITILGCFLFMETEAQVKKTVREVFNVPKSECKIYVFKVDSCLKALSIYKDQKDEFIYDNNIEVPTYKILLGGKKTLPDYDFIVDITVNEVPENSLDEPKNYLWDYGLLEVGFRTEELAKEAQ